MALSFALLSCGVHVILRGTLALSVRIHCFMRNRSNRPQQMAQLIVADFAKMFSKNSFLNMQINEEKKSKKQHKK